MSINKSGRSEAYYRELDEIFNFHFILSHQFRQTPLAGFFIGGTSKPGEVVRFEIDEVNKYIDIITNHLKTIEGDKALLTQKHNFSSYTVFLIRCNLSKLAVILWSIKERMLEILVPKLNEERRDDIMRTEVDQLISLEIRIINLQVFLLTTPGGDDSSDSHCTELSNILYVNF